MLGPRHTRGGGSSPGGPPPAAGPAHRVSAEGNVRQRSVKCVRARIFQISVHPNSLAPGSQRESYKREAMTPATEGVRRLTTLRSTENLVLRWGALQQILGAQASLTG